MNFVTIKLPIEKDETKDDTLLTFHENISSFLENEIDYSEKGVLDMDSKEVFVGIKLNDNDLKDLIDATPGNSFEIIDSHWPQFLKMKSDDGAQTFEVKKIEKKH